MRLIALKILVSLCEQVSFILPHFHSLPFGLEFELLVQNYLCSLCLSPVVCEDEDSGLWLMHVGVVHLLTPYNSLLRTLKQNALLRLGAWLLVNSLDTVVADTCIWLCNDFAVCSHEDIRCLIANVSSRREFTAKRDLSLPSWVVNSCEIGPKPTDQGVLSRTWSNWIGTLLLR